MCMLVEARWRGIDTVSGLVYDLRMASLTKKVIRGRTYYYARECQRVNGRPKIVWQKYLGRLDDIIAAAADQPVLAPPREAVVAQLGAVAALYDLAARLDLAATIDRHVPKRGHGVSVGTYLLVGVLNRCVDPRSKAGIGEWFDTTMLRRLLPITAGQLSSQRFWENMGRVSAEAIAAIEGELVARAVAEFGLNLNRLLFDATNFFTFLDTFNDHSQLAQRGKSKEGRASLRIVGVALLVSADFHVPLLHSTYPGNQADAPTFASLCKGLVERCRRLAADVEHVTLVFDKGNNSQDNLDEVKKAPYHFVGSLVTTQHADLLSVPRDEFRSLAAEGLPGVLAYRTRKKVFGAMRTVIVTYNEELFIAQAKTILRDIAKRQRLLQECAARLEEWRSGTLKGRAPTAEGLRKKTAAWLKRQHMKRLFEVAVVEQEKGPPQLLYEFKQAAWEELQKNLLGKTILFTDNDDWSDVEIVHAYRGQHVVESAFRAMKDVHHIALRPQFHWTDQKIRVHVFICVLALMLASLLRRELHSNGVTLSIEAMLDTLGKIQEVTVVEPPQARCRTPRLRTTLTAMNTEQQHLFDVLNLGRYTSP